MKQLTALGMLILLGACGTEDAPSGSAAPTGGKADGFETGGPQLCDAFRPSGTYFDAEYMLYYYNGPNFDDICFENYVDDDETAACYAESAAWGGWLSCVASTGGLMDAILAAELPDPEATFRQNLAYREFCAAQKPPGARFFDEQYILDAYGGPNWDDQCFENYSGETMTACFDEGDVWGEWLGCLTTDPDQLMEVLLKYHPEFALDVYRRLTR